MSVADVRRGQTIDATFVVADCETRTTRGGDPFLRLTLRDASGNSIDARYFGVPTEVAAEVEAGATYDVRGQGDEWQGRRQIKVSEMHRTEEQWDATALLPQSEKSSEQLQSVIEAAAANIRDAEIRAVVEALLEDDRIAERFSKWPAAKTRHHAWIGGLAEHVGEMLAIAERVAEVFPSLNRDLLTAGVIAHDIGKILELDLTADISYSNAGNLEGHMVQGTRLLDDALTATGCSEETAMLLRHLVLSHQGTREFAAVVEPMTAEAIALHYIDQLSSQVRPALEDLAAARRRGTKSATFRGPTSMRTLYAPSGESTGRSEPLDALGDLPF